MYEIELPDTVQEEIRHYFKKINETKHQLKGQKEFFNSISPQLKQEVKITIFKDALLESKCFLSLKIKFRRQH